jgi:hypothetical protein
MYWLFEVCGFQSSNISQKQSGITEPHLLLLSDNKEAVTPLAPIKQIGIASFFLRSLSSSFRGHTY